MSPRKPNGRTATNDTDALSTYLEQYRVELTGYCYRMLASAFEAEDAVQETLIRAWQGFDGFKDRAAIRSWLYRIATNVCLDMLRSAQRRARPMDLAAPSKAETPIGAPLPESAWIEPISDARALPLERDPAERVVLRESIRLAFVAALQHLPPRQRAVLILREVLNWKAAEVAHLLESSVVSVNSALQRARSTLASINPPESDAYMPDDEKHQALLARYVDAFEGHDIETLLSLLHEDATMSMPPFTWWVRGRSEIRRCFLASDACAGDRLVPTVANGSMAFGQYRPYGPKGTLKPFALCVVDLSAGQITGSTAFLDAAKLFPVFNLPARLGT